MDMPAELTAGYRRFRRERYALESERYKRLVAGQVPKTMIVACADSRVDPASIFSAGPGELFVVRNVAALVPPCEETGRCHGTSAAIEFAVTQLKVAHLVVMGHGLCGGIAAALAAAEHQPVGTFMGPWVGVLADVRDKLIAATRARDPQLRQGMLERLAIQHSLGNLMSFPFVKTAVESGKLVLHGAWFSIAEGELEWLDRQKGTFRRVDVDEKA
jgi:carbonic anhydrase